MTTKYYIIEILVFWYKSKSVKQLGILYIAFRDYNSANQRKHFERIEMLHRFQS